MGIELYKPKELKCVYCQFPEFGVTQTRGPNSSPPFLDYTWRNLKCVACSKHMQWGEPTTTGHTHMVMTKTPKIGSDNKTANVDMALPIGATIQDLRLHAIKVELTHIRDNYIYGRGNRPLSPAEVEELKRILESAKVRLMRKMNGG